MPVSSRLSRLLYERLGEEEASELLSWLQTLNTSNRTDLDGINQLNLRQFDAKLEQGKAELTSRMVQLESRLEAKLERRLSDQILLFMAIWSGVVFAAIIGFSSRR